MPFAPSRDQWVPLAEVKRAYAASVLDEGEDAAFRLAHLARARMLEIDPAWPGEDERRADLEAHVALAAKLAKLGPTFGR